ncbi:hypothetical protein P691DRAFT_765653 [Macrolepiota fuliginosa MF-IS2]|uniref:Uncharacterized protein n=1 Tax=Macrolepiota fuliginosa MF-IS2 TaxID=1400762 RepID=A0A9P6BWL2_9AGAR|nr:hypothetical protein P691DRAFT_765653 [Macrolepiota fuliginosa MF-IS2]
MTKKPKKPDTKLLPNTNDDQYIDIDEPSDGRSGGRLMKALKGSGVLRVEGARQPGPGHVTRAVF